LLKDGEFFLARVFDGETILKNTLWDVQRMISEQRDPVEILDLLEAKVAWLKKPKWYKVRWWNSTERTRTTKTNEEPHGFDDEDIKDYD
jgi:hypothetical protein